MWDRVGCIWTTLTCAQAYSWLVQRSLLQTWDHRRCRSWNWTQIDSLQGKHLTPLTLMWRIFKCPFHDITLLTMVLKPEVFKKAMVLKPEVIWVSSTGWGGSSLESLTCVGRDWHLVTLPRGWALLTGVYLVRTYVRAGREAPVGKLEVPPFFQAYLSRPKACPVYQSIVFCSSTTSVVHRLVVSTNKMPDSPRTFYSFPFTQRCQINEFWSTS